MKREMRGIACNYRIWCRDHNGERVHEESQLAMVRVGNDGKTDWEVLYRAVQDHATSWAQRMYGDWRGWVEWIEYDNGSGLVREYVKRGPHRAGG